MSSVERLCYNYFSKSQNCTVFFTEITIFKGMNHSYLLQLIFNFTETYFGCGRVLWQIFIDTLSAGICSFAPKNDLS